MLTLHPDSYILLDLLRSIGYGTLSNYVKNNWYANMRWFNIVAWSVDNPKSYDEFPKLTTHVQKRMSSKYNVRLYEFSCGERKGRNIVLFSK